MPKLYDNIYDVKPIKQSIDKLKPQIQKITRSKGGVDYKLERINTLIGGYGVVSAPGKWVDKYYGDTNLLYVNMGDTYEPTVIYDTVKKKWYIGVSWGDIVESEPTRFAL